MASLIKPLLNVTFQAFNYMEGLFRKGMSSNAVQSIMSRMGQGYRRSTIQAVARKVKDVLKFESYYRTLPLGKRASPFRIPDLTWNRHEKYKIMYNFQVIDEETGKITNYRGSHYDNDYLTKGEYAQRIQDELEPAKYKDQGKIIEITITQVTHKKGFSY